MVGHVKNKMDFIHRGRFDLDLCFVADIRLGERIGAAKDRMARLRAIRAGCRQIAQLWDGVVPRPSILKKAD